MEFAEELILSVVVGAGATLITVRILIAELKRDMTYLKQEINNIKEEKKNDIAEIKNIIKDNNEERKSSLSKLENHIEQIFTALTDIKVQIAKKE